MDLDFNGDLASLDPELLQLAEVPALAIKANPGVAVKLFDQWLSLPETNSLVILRCVLFPPVHQFLYYSLAVIVVDWGSLLCSQFVGCIKAGMVHVGIDVYKRGLLLYM